MGLTPMKRVLGLATCFNRKVRTISAIEQMMNTNPTISFEFLLFDDSSTDGTPEALAQYDNVTVLHGDGNSF